MSSESPYFSKIFRGLHPPAHQPCIIVMSDYCCPTNVVCFSKIFRGLRPPSPQICIIVMSDYCCPTNFFNAKCCLNHPISQKFFGGCAPKPTNLVLLYCLIIAVLQMSSVSQKFTEGLRPPSPPTLYYCDF